MLLWFWSKTPSQSHVLGVGFHWLKVDHAWRTTALESTADSVLRGRVWRNEGPWMWMWTPSLSPWLFLFLSVFFLPLYKQFSSKRFSVWHSYVVASWWWIKASEARSQINLFSFRLLGLVFLSQGQETDSTGASYVLCLHHDALQFQLSATVCIRRECSGALTSTGRGRSCKASLITLALTVHVHLQPPVPSVLQEAGPRTQRQVRVPHRGKFAGNPGSAQFTAAWGWLHFLWVLRSDHFFFFNILVNEETYK